MIKYFKFLLFLLFAFFVVKYSYADEFHYQDVLVGGKAAGMGGAFTAIADDSSAAYYNPAGLTNVKENNISLSANVFQYRSKTYKDFVFGEDITLTSFGFFPTSSGSVNTKKGFKYGFSIVVPDSSNYTAKKVEVENLYSSTGTVNLRFDTEESNQTYLIGGVVAKEVIDELLSLGISLYYIYGSYSGDFYAYIKDVATDTITSELINEVNGTKTGVQGHIGVLYNLSDFLDLGLIVRIATDPSHKEESRRIFYDGGERVSESETSGSFEGETEYSSEIPLSGTFGLAYIPNDKLTFDIDLSLYSSVSYRDIKKDFIYNLNLGSEYFISQNIPIRAGIFTNLSSAPEIEDGEENQEEKVDYYGITIGAGFIGANTVSSVGLKYAYGVGEYIDVTDSKIDVNAFDMAIFISSMYKF